MKTKFSLIMLLLAAWVMIGCEPVNEPTTEEGGTTTVDDSNIASVNKVTNYYGTIYEVILKDGNRMYFGIKNDSEVRMGNWSYFYDGSEYEYEKYAEYEYKGHLVIPEKITLEGKEYTVTELYDMSHADIGYYDVANTTLLSVVVPNTIKKITFRCFEACTALKSVKFEKGSPIQELVYRCFKGCSSLEEVILPDNLSFIGGEAFALCTSLKTINLPKTVTKIQDGTFMGCTSLENVDLDKLEVLGENTFNGCTSLKKVELPNANKIMDNAFHGCTSLKNINLESTINIYDYAFQKCISLEEVKLDNLEVLGACAFDSCISLKQIELPSIKYFGVSAKGDDEDKHWIAGYALKNCHSLETVILGSSLRQTNYVYDNSLFYDCNSLKDVYCYATNPPMYVDWQVGRSDYRKFVGDFVLHVPASSIEAYKETAWGDVYRVREDDGFIYQDDVRTIVAIEE